MYCPIHGYRRLTRPGTVGTATTFKVASALSYNWFAPGQCHHYGIRAVLASTTRSLERFIQQQLCERFLQVTMATGMVQAPRSLSLNEAQAGTCRV